MGPRCSAGAGRHCHGPPVVARGFLPASPAASASLLLVPGPSPPMPPTPQAIADCIHVLEALVAEPALLAAIDRDVRQRLVMAAGRVSRPSRAEQTQLSRARAKLL